jgi:hypothetical protein
MTLNNTPFKWKNKTEFIPAKSPEKTMSTYDYLNNAENELRNALKSSTDLSQAYQLRRMVDTITTVSEIKNQFKMSVTENNNITSDGFFHIENYQNPNTSMSISSTNSDQIIFG